MLSGCSKGPAYPGVRWELESRGDSKQLFTLIVITWIATKTTLDRNALKFHMDNGSADTFSSLDLVHYTSLGHLFSIMVP